MKARGVSIFSLIDDVDQEIEEIIFNLRPLEDRSLRLKKISDNFQSKQPVSDYEMDHLFPPEIARKSHPHWTPTDVAARALELLATTEQSNLLDVGSGCGKFCIIAGLSAKGKFTGVEQRKYLVDVADQIMNEFQIKNVSFIHENMSNLDWSNFDCLYLFNPFYENRMSDPIYWIDNTLPINGKIFDRYIHTVHTKLKTTKIGTRVVTYHGFGGKFPPEYDCLIREPAATGHLELWVKVE